MDKTLRRVGTIAAIRPNWASPVKEYLSFQTSIFTSRDGTEQRESMRQSPRISYEFGVDTFRGLGRRIAADLKQWPADGLYVFPISWRYAVLVGDVIGGSDTLGLDRTPPWWMKEGSKLVLESDEAQEVVEILSVGAFSVTLTAPTTEEFFVGNRVMMARDVRYSKETSLSSLVSEHRRMNAKLDVDPGDIDFTGMSNRARYHEGYDALTVRPNWRSPISSIFDDQREVVDFDVGVIDVSRYRDFTIHRETMNFTLMDEQSVDDLTAFFLRLKGQKLPFWVPTHLSDAEWVSGGAQGTSTLTVEGTEFKDAYEDDETYTSLAVLFPNGGIQINRMVSMIESSGNTLITFEVPWELDVTEEAKISFGFHARLMSDRLTINWLTDGKGEISLSYRALPNAYMAPDKIIELTSVIPPDVTQNEAEFDEETEYAEIDFVEEGIPLSAVDRGLAFADLYFFIQIGRTPLYEALGLHSSGQVSAAIQAYDADGNALPLINGQTNPGAGNTIKGSDDGDGSFLVNETINLRPGTRFLRVKQHAILLSGAVILQRECTGSVRTRDWGLGYDIEDLL